VALAYSLPTTPGLQWDRPVPIHGYIVYTEGGVVLAAEPFHLLPLHQRFHAEEGREMDGVLRERSRDLLYSDTNARRSPGGALPEGDLCRKDEYLFGAVY